MPRVESAQQTDNTDVAGGGSGDASSIMSMPPREHISAADLARIRAPAARNAADLKALLSYVADMRKGNSAANTTAATIDAIRKRMAPNSATQRAATNPATSAVGDPNPAAARLDSSVKKLYSTMDRVAAVRTDIASSSVVGGSVHSSWQRTNRNGGGGGSGPSGYYVDPEDRSPERVTEREVARMLLESSNGPHGFGSP